MVRPFLIAALVILPGIAQAQTRATNAGGTPDRVRSVTLKPGEKCPPNTSEEIIVCSTLDQPYRIPKNLRDDKPIAAANQSWVNRTATIDEVGRTAGGLPDTCSTVGTGGQSGCALAANKAWAAEKRAQRSADAVTP